MLRKLALLTALFEFGCSSSVELSAPPHLTASSDPTVLAVVNERVAAIAVDDRRLYWLGSVDGREVSDSTLHSCEKQNCADSLVTYSAGDRNLGTRFGLVGGQIYWLEASFVDSRMVGKLHACDVSGCGKGARTVASNIANPTALAFDAKHAYVSVLPSTVLRFALSDNDAPPDETLATPGGYDSLEVQGDYLYWIGRVVDPGPASLSRVSVDGSGNVEIVADQLRVYDSPPAARQNALTVDASYAYWSDGLLSGSIVRCPVTGCIGTPELLTGPVRLPTTLLLDGSTLYWQQETESSGAVVSSCDTAACAPTAPVVRGVDDFNALAVDDDYIYTATTDQKVEPYEVWGNLSANIRRIHK